MRNRGALHVHPVPTGCFWFSYARRQRDDRRQSDLSEAEALEQIDQHEADVEFKIIGSRHALHRTGDGPEFEAFDLAIFGARHEIFGQNEIIALQAVAALVMVTALRRRP